MTGDRVVARAVDSAFRCDVCGERCTSKRALDEHATSHPEGQRRRRFRECAEQFGSEGEYDPRCCRFPKSCSPYPYPEAIVADDDLEPLRCPPWTRAVQTNSNVQLRPERIP